MTVGELIEKLKTMPQDAAVWRDSDRGDYEYTGAYMEMGKLCQVTGTTREPFLVSAWETDAGVEACHGPCAFRTVLIL